MVGNSGRIESIDVVELRLAHQAGCNPRRKVRGWGVQIAALEEARGHLSLRGIQSGPVNSEEGLLDAGHLSWTVLHQLSCYTIGKRGRGQRLEEIYILNTSTRIGLPTVAQARQRRRLVRGRDIHQALGGSKPHCV